MNSMAPNIDVYIIPDMKTERLQENTVTVKAAERQKMQECRHCGNLD